MFCKIYFLLGIQNFFSELLLILVILSVFISGILALKYAKIKRFFALTTINLNGFLFICLASSSLDAVGLSIIYLFIYNILLFFIFIKLSNYPIKNHSSLLISEIDSLFSNTLSMK